MRFNVIGKNQSPPNSGTNEAYLRIDYWNDFSFVTMFYVWLFDENGAKHDLGNVKIGFKDQDESISTYSTIQSGFENLGDDYFSLGTDLSYYLKLTKDLSPSCLAEYLQGINDVVANPDLMAIAENERVWGTSLLRDVSLSTVYGQFRRVLEGGVALTDFDFIYTRPQEDNFAGVELDFKVAANSKPSTNIHAIIGRNGAGKTTLMNGMIDAIVNQPDSKSSFLQVVWPKKKPIGTSYFSNLVSISFSAFDPFSPPPERSDPKLGTCYVYVGLKDCEDETGTRLKSLSALYQDFIASVGQCFSETQRTERWLSAISTLESDENFSEMNLKDLASNSLETLESRCLSLLKRMSSGHVIVLLIITKLVAKVEEKTLVLLDEPESHLHPPLLSAFTRALSELLHNRNGVGIIATHSPVVLQEIPRSCVWKITRSRLAISAARPDVETFGENVGILTREVFGLEVVKSGYHTLLAKSVSEGLSYNEILQAFDGNVGFEAKAVIRAMISNRDGSAEL